LRKVPILDLSETSITWLEQAEDGSIWFRQQAGAGRWDGTKCLSFTRTNGFTSAYVTCARRGAAGAMWFGTAGDGAYCYNGRSFEHFTKAHGLAGDSVYSIYHDTDGLLWFATNEGVSRYNGEGFVNLTPEDGLTIPSMNSVLRDENGLLWFGCLGSGGQPGGVWRYDEGSFSKFTMADGLLGNTATWAFAIPDGTVWFGGNGHATHFDGKQWVHLTGLTGITYGVARTADGRLWFEVDHSRGFPLVVYDGVRCTRPEGEGWAALGDPQQERFWRHWDALSAAPDGGLWLATHEGLFHFHGGKLEQNALKNLGFTNDISSITSLHCDAQGTVFFARHAGWAVGTPRHYDGQKAHAGLDSKWTSVVRRG
jgi:ligand-binding sensor domain-containing protein